MIETFKHRNTGFVDIVAFEDDYVKDSQRQMRWNAFVKKKKAMVKVELSDVVNVIRDFLNPIVEEIHKGEIFNQRWNHSKREWID